MRFPPYLPRIHGDEPFPDGFVVGIDAFNPRIHGDEPIDGSDFGDYRLFAPLYVLGQVHKNMFRFWINVDQKVLSAKIYFKEMMHTDLVVEIRNNRNQQCVNRGNFFEEFSIRPVRTGMSRLEVLANGNGCNLLRAYGDEPNFGSLYYILE